MQPTILIIDDNEDEAIITRMVLSKIRRDIRMEVALSGEIGLEIIRKGKVPPALVLLDLKMPGMNGNEVLRKIRDDRALTGIPVVILTNSDLEADEQACVEAGADCFLHKAVNLDRFQKDMECILARWLDTNIPPVS